MAPAKVPRREIERIAMAISSTMRSVNQADPDPIAAAACGCAPEKQNSAGHCVIDEKLCGPRERSRNQSEGKGRESNPIAVRGGVADGVDGVAGFSHGSTRDRA